MKSAMTLHWVCIWALVCVLGSAVGCGPSTKTKELDTTTIPPPHEDAPPPGSDNQQAV